MSFFSVYVVCSKRLTRFSTWFCLCFLCWECIGSCFRLAGCQNNSEDNVRKHLSSSSSYNVSMTSAAGVHWALVQALNPWLDLLSEGGWASGFFPWLFHWLPVFYFGFSVPICKLEISIPILCGDQDSVFSKEFWDIRTVCYRSGNFYHLGLVSIACMQGCTSE